MSYALLLDSSNSKLSVGLARDGSLFDAIEYEANQRQSELMVGEIGNILTRNSLGKDDLSSVVVCKGPGSYTGVRIALTIAKTAALGLSIPLYMVSSLEALKDGDNPSICLSNARGKRSYFGVYKGDECLIDDCIMDNEKVVSYISENPTFSLCGDLQYLGLNTTLNTPLPTLAKCAKKKYEAEPLGASPVYLKDTGNSALKVIVRKMNSADILQVLDIENECFSAPYTHENFLYELNENPFATMLVAMVGPDIVGYIDFMITFDSATINRIAVKEEYRKKGIGNRLLGECVKLCREREEPVENLTLEVRKSNQNAIRFYKKHAFKEIVVKPQYYSDGEDAIYMVRSIIND